MRFSRSLKTGFLIAVASLCGATSASSQDEFSGTVVRIDPASRCPDRAFSLEGREIVTSPQTSFVDTSCDAIEI